MLRLAPQDEVRDTMLRIAPCSRGLGISGRRHTPPPEEPAARASRRTAPEGGAVEVGERVIPFATSLGMRFLSGASIYILRCADSSYYTGITRRSVDERVSEHAQRIIHGCYTHSRRPVKLVFAEHYERIDEAIAGERRINGWSRAKKEAYMRGEFPTLVELAKRATRSDKKA